MPDTGFDSIALSGGYLHNAAVKERMGVATIAVTGASETSFIAKFSGTLAACIFTSKDALAASDTNFVTLTIVNRGQAGAGTTAMLAAVDANTTKVTGGAALTLYGRRTLTLSATPANLAVLAGDLISVLATATGTLANTVTAPSFLMTFTPTPS